MAEVSEMVEIAALASSLGISDKRLARMVHKMGDDLLSWLKEARVWADEQDADRYLHDNPGMAKDDYTSEPWRAMRSGEVEQPRELAVPADFQNVLVTKAKERFMEHRRTAHAAEEAAKDIEAVKTEMRELVKRAVKMGVDPSTVIAPIAREIQAQHAQLRKAA